MCADVQSRFLPMSEAISMKEQPMSSSAVSRVQQLMTLTTRVISSRRHVPSSSLIGVLLLFVFLFRLCSHSVHLIESQTEKENGIHIWTALASLWWRAKARLCFIVAHVTTPNHRYMAFSFFMACMYSNKKVTESNYAYHLGYWLPLLPW
jgi:hypothetical protein